MATVTIIGATSWGTVLGVVLAQKGIGVKLWARTEQEAEDLKNNRIANLPPDTVLPERLLITTQLKEAMANATAVIMAVPSQRMRENMKLATKHIKKSTIIVSAAKGLEIGTGKRMSQVIADEIPNAYHKNICVLSGPNLALEILQGLPAATVAAAEDAALARKIQRLLTTPNLCVFTNSDIIGVELGGALKNIVALGAGIVDGLGYGDNAKAAFMTRGLTEISALGVALGANPLTLYGLAGLGDVITTCASQLSRNHYVGFELAKGRNLQEITSTMTGVAEGVTTTPVARDLARKHGLEMPITEKVYQVLYEELSPRQAAVEMMGGNTKHELSGRKWRLFSFFRRRKNTPV